MTVQGPPKAEKVGFVEHWVRWSRENLFSSVVNSILTLISLAVVYLVIRGMTAWIFAAERKWYVIPPNMKLYWTDIYPPEAMARMWVSLGIALALTGLSLAIWRAGGRLTPAKLAQALTGLGVALVVLAAIAPMPPALRLWTAVIGLFLAGLAWLLRRLYSGREDAELIPMMSILFVVALIILAVVWILHIETGTKVALTIQFLVLVGSYLLGVVARSYLPESALRSTMMGLWLLSLPFIYMVVQRAPDTSEVPVTSMVIPYAAAFLVVGVAYVWWAGSPGVGEAPRIIAALLVLASIAVWVTSIAVLARFLLLALAMFGLASSTFGGTERGRNGLVAGWLVMDLLITYFTLMAMAKTGLPAIGGFIGGLNMTFILAGGGILLAAPIGISLALGRTSKMPIFRLLSTGYIEVIRGIPMITVLFFGDLVINRFLPPDVAIDRIVRALIAIALFAGAYLAENVRGGLQAIPKGQKEAAQALGLTTVQMTVLVTLPQALRSVIPAIVGQVITMFKDTSLVAIIGLTDFLRIARDVVPNQPASLGSMLESLLFASVVYWIFSFATSRASMRLEKKLGVGER